MVALNVIVNMKYNKCLLVVVGNAFCFLFFSSSFCWSYVWSRLLLFAPCSLVFSVSTCTSLSMALVEFFFSEIILDICELLLSLLEIRVVMQCNDAIIWVLASLPLLAFLGNQVQGTLYWTKKICVRDDSRSKVPLLLFWMLLVDH